MEFEKIVLFILVLVEACLGFCLVFPEILRRNFIIGEKVRICLPILLVSIAYAYNGQISWISTIMEFIFTILTGILFLLINKKHALSALVWGFTYITFIYLLKLSVLLWEGIKCKKNIIYVNRFGNNRLHCITEIILIVILFIAIYWIKKRKFSLRDLCRKNWVLLVVIDLVEYKIMSYIMRKSMNVIEKPYLLINIAITLVIALAMFILGMICMIWQLESEKKLLVLRQKLQNDYQVQLQQRYDEIAQKITTYNMKEIFYTNVWNRDVLKKRVCFFRRKIILTVRI